MLTSAINQCALCTEPTTVEYIISWFIIRFSPQRCFILMCLYFDVNVAVFVYLGVEILLVVLCIVLLHIGLYYLKVCLHFIGLFFRVTKARSHERSQVSIAITNIHTSEISAKT